MTTIQLLQRIKVKTLCIYLACVSVLSCSLFTPSLPSVPPIASSPAPTTKVTAISKDVESSLWNYAWLSILLVLFFPSARKPIVELIISVTNVMRLPFDHIQRMYNDKFNNGKKQ